MLRRVTLALTALVILAGSAIAPAGTKEAPTALTPANDAAHALAWTDTVSPAGTNSFWFVAKLGKARAGRVTTWVDWGTPEDLDVTIYDAAGTRVGGSAADPGETEIASYNVKNGETYEVRVTGFVNVSTTINGYTWVRSVSGRNFKGAGKLRYAKKDILATVDIPINIVFVGFDPAEVAANKQTLLTQLPPAFRPAVRIGSGTGGVAGGTIRRDLGRGPVRNFLGDVGTNIQFEPLLFKYKYNVITATETYSKALMAAAKAASQTGDYQLNFDREFIERYNARAGAALRGAGKTVAPGTDIQFVDGMKLEDWVAAHPPPGIDFDLSKPANGYTYFVVDSFRPAYAADSYDATKYHNFRVMNELTTDPDSGSQNGFDWGRVWGGRFRFLMLDVGAAPNGWEAVTNPQTKVFRVAGNGDSSIMDPPIWEYKQDLSSFYERVGEDVQYAIWMRFTRGYLYRPTPYDKFILAANTWHDNAAYTPWPSKLEMLYKDQLVLHRYKELIPYATFEAFSNFKYLAPGDPEQDAIDEGKQQSAAGAPAPFTVSTKPVMRLIDRNRPKYAPLKPGAFTIPIVNVVFEGLSTWDTPLIVGGIAEGEGGDPWGQLQNVNNRTKWPGATTTVTDSAGTSHAPLVPDQRVQGIDNLARFGFTATALHEAGHFLGLSHNHDAIAYDWTFNANAADPSKPDGYYGTSDWMYTTTATPEGYGWEYNKFEVLDKDNVWIGHSLEWLTQAQEALSDAYAALDSKRFSAVTPTVKAQQASAEGHIAASVAALKSGRYLDAVKAARAAYGAAINTIDIAAGQVLGGTVTRPAPGKPGGPLPATGVGSAAGLAATLFATALALAAVLLRRETKR
jgi:hypothetical protein